ncbi:hypothetical protein HOG48_01230 [Candidatus Peregrinibacteria bacterium]|jgi:hypothetical protein|nr:hypothetical protein [Candidatus Peregrinibacteria bacterium]
MTIEIDRKDFPILQLLDGIAERKPGMKIPTEVSNAMLELRDDLCTTLGKDIPFSKIESLEDVNRILNTIFTTIIETQTEKEGEEGKGKEKKLKMIQDALKEFFEKMEEAMPNLLNKLDVNDLRSIIKIAERIDSFDLKDLLYVQPEDPIEVAAQMTESRTGMQKHLTWLERQKVNLDPNPFRNIDPTEWQISPRRIKRLITEHRKSIFPLFGPAIAIALFMEEILNPDGPIQYSNETPENIFMAICAFAFVAYIFKYSPNESPNINARTVQALPSLSTLGNPEELEKIEGGKIINAQLLFNKKVKGLSKEISPKELQEILKLRSRLMAGIKALEDSKARTDSDRILEGIIEITAQADAEQELEEFVRACRGQAKQSELEPAKEPERRNPAKVRQ